MIILSRVFLLLLLVEQIRTEPMEIEHELLADIASRYFSGTNGEEKHAAHLRLFLFVSQISRCRPTLARKSDDFTV